jgi:hypothetical protein
MKRLVSALLALLFLLAALPAAADSFAPASDALLTWIAAFISEYQNSDPAALKPIVPVQGWPTYYGGDWTSQYPADWSVVRGDTYSFMAGDSRGLDCYCYVQMLRFPQAYTHDQLALYILNSTTGGAPYTLVNTCQKNMFPQLMLTPPSGIAQLYFVRWKHPQAGMMFTLINVQILAYFNGYPIGSTSVSWSLYSAPESEFIDTWQNVFAPMLYSATYTIPKNGTGEVTDSDGDGYTDDVDAYPTDPNLH